MSITQPNGVQNIRQTKIGLGGGATMCHNILLPSKGSNELRNIPFNISSAI